MKRPDKWKGPLVKGGLHEQGLEFRAKQREAGIIHLAELIGDNYIDRTDLEGKIKFSIQKPLPRVQIGINGELGIYRMNALLHKINNCWITHKQWEEELDKLYENLVDYFKSPG